MAGLYTSAVSSYSFTRLKSTGATAWSFNAATIVKVKFSIKSSFKEARIATVAFAAGALVAKNALAIEVLLGDEDGGLAFVPSNFTVASGEQIVFKNNKAFPHNVIFDEDEIPAGVDAGKISMGEDELLNGEGDTFIVTLTVKGTYSFYCAPHQGAGMVGQITVN